jgi:hypothetical protein
MKELILARSAASQCSYQLAAWQAAHIETLFVSRETADKLESIAVHLRAVGRLLVEVQDEVYA